MGKKEIFEMEYQKHCETSTHKYNFSSKNKAKRAKSSITEKYHNRCMDMICTCNDPNHLCPTNYPPPGYFPKSEYQQEYIAKNGQVEVPYKYPDHLKFGKVFFDKTCYKVDYDVKEIPSFQIDTIKRNQKLNKMLENSIKNGHLKEIVMPGSKNLYFERPKSSCIQEEYVKPSKWFAPLKGIPQNKTFVKETEYQKEFKEKNYSQERLTKQNYDNLKIYTGKTKPEISTYKREFSPVDNKRKINNRCKSSSPINLCSENEKNKTLYEINKLNNNMTSFSKMDNGLKNKTEYSRNYYKKTIEVKECSIKNLPPVPEKLLRQHKHIFYDGIKHEWKISS